jgi:NAD-dependent DNA ligase
MPSQPTIIKGKNIVISGNLFYFPNHEVLRERLEALGANVSRRISKKTDILIIGEDGTTGRIQDVLAEEQGICILLESELMPYL